MAIVKFEQHYVIIFQDKSRVHLNDADHKKFMSGMQSGVDGIQLNGNYYRFSSVAKILTQAEFYQQYPQHIPASSQKIEIKDREQLDEKRLRAGWVRAIQTARRNYPKCTWEWVRHVLPSLVKKYSITEQETE